MPAAAAPVGAMLVAVKQLVGHAGGDRVDRVVEDVDGNLLRRPEHHRRGDLESWKRHLGAAPDRGPVCGSRRASGHTGGREQATHHAPAGAVAPVRQVVEARRRDIVLEGRDSKRLGRRSRRRGARLATPQPRLDRARNGHRGGAGKARDQALADAARERAEDLHDSTCAGLPLPPRSAAGSTETCASSRSRMCSPTLTAFAVAVSAGFTALEDGKKLVSTTYRLSTSWALQWTSSTESAGSVPKRAVPHAWAMPASGICWSSTEKRGIAVVWHPSGPSRSLSLPSNRLCGSWLA